jgi:choline dehydrogenase-like flavoprotein
VSQSTRADLDATFSSDWPDIELLSLDAHTGSLNDFIFGAPDLKNYTSVCAVIVAPFSRGNVTIASDNTNIHPVVNPNWLTDPRDQEVAVAAFKRARDVFSAQDVQAVLVSSEAFPRASVQSDKDILSIIMSSSDTIHHAAVTNRMGKADDPLAVVDHEGKSFVLTVLHLALY